ncbi:MAG TPA: DUF2141 domain-containing protein [Novosphingobium sp.]|nr:DUF2141 domain-containing protein [Novosphingobium sp.]
MPEGGLSISVTGLRSNRGQVLACLMTDARAFPDCSHDPAAHRLAVPATSAVVLDFGRLAPGRYAVSLLHDENGNGKADMVLMMPREGFGFSRDAAVRFGPPRFERAAFDVAGTEIHQAIRMRYMF